MKTSLNIRFVFLILLAIKSILLLGNSNEDIVDSLNQILIEEQNDSIRVYTLVQLSQLYSTYDLKASIYDAEQALAIAEKSRNTELIEYALFNAGSAHFGQGLFELAAIYIYAYLEIQKEKDNKVGIAYALSNIGALRLRMNDYSSAKSSFFSALRILKELPEDSPNYKYIAQIPIILNNIGIVYQNEQEYDSSLFYYRTSLTQSEFVNNSDHFKAGVMNNIGDLFLDINEVDSAFTYLSLSMEIRRENNDYVGQSASHIQLADYYLSINQFDKALEYFYESAKLANKIGSIDLQNLAAEKLYNYYFLQKNADSALKYYILHNSLKDTINNSETLKELTRLQITSEFNERKKVEQIEQSRLNTIYMFTALVLVLLLLVFVLLYILSNNRNYRLNLEKNNMALSAKNAFLENKNLHNELEVRNKELTTHVMNMIKKNEVIRQIMETLSASRPNLDAKNSDFLTTIIKDLNKLKDESAWEEFELRYQQVHTGFYEKLQLVAPSLTTNERRLCAFLRLNMTTKDIASVTGQTLRSIEVARTRLRKKLDISHSDISLVEFLNAL